MKPSMVPLQVQVSGIDKPLPAIAEPCAILIDANDEDWVDGGRAERLIKKLLDAGCRYFVCFGKGAEAVHDRIDDVVLELECDGVTTTFHDDESKEDVAEFFSSVAIVDMQSALALVRDVPGWRALL